MARIKYIRVSTKEQNTARQEQDKALYDKVYLEKISGKDTNRPQLQAMLDYVREGDVVEVESYSRLARDTRDLLNIIDSLQKQMEKQFMENFHLLQQYLSETFVKLFGGGKAELRLVDEKDVLSTEKALMKVIPEDQWTVNHHRLIWHGRTLCTARKPQCGECPLLGICLQKMGK